MQSTIKLVSQLNIAEQTEEYELRKFAERIKDEVKTENELNEEFEELTLKLNEAVRILEEQTETANNAKQNQKNQIKSLNEHEMVGNQGILQQIKQRQSQRNEIEMKMTETEKKYETEWMIESKSIDKKFVDLQNENQTLKDEMKQFKHKIKENERIFDELQKEIEIKRENILKYNKEKEEFVVSTNKRNDNNERCLERIQRLEREITEKESQIQNEKLNALEITNKLEILRGFKVNKERFDEQMTNINKLKIKNKESEKLNESLQKEIEAIYNKLENFSENKIFPLQSIISSNEPILNQKIKQKQDLLCEIQNKEQIFQKLKNQKEKKENELKKSMENEKILNQKIKEKQNELNEITEKFENKKEHLIGLTTKINKIRKWSLKLLHDKQRMKDYMTQKHHDPLLTFTKSELNRDFEIDSKGIDVQIFGSDLTALHHLMQKEHNELNVLNESINKLTSNQLKQTMDKKNELESINKQEETALNQQIQKKQQIASDLNKINNQQIETVTKTKQILAKDIETLNIKISEETDSFKRKMLDLDEFGSKTLKEIDKLHDQHIAIKKPLQQKNDEMSKNNIDVIHNLKKELNDEKSKYQHLKVKLRQMQRK